MTRTGIKIGLDVSDLVSNAGRAAGAISKLTDAMAQAEREGRRDDIGKFAHEIERLQGRNVGFDKEFRNILAGPGKREQSRSASFVEIDSGYEEAVRSHMAAMNGLTAKYEKAIAKGDMTGLEKISSLLDTQYGELMNTFREARDLPRMSGSFSAKERPQTQEPLSQIEQPRQTEPHEQFPDQHKPKQGETRNPLGGIVFSAETLNEVIRSLDTRIAVARKDGDHPKAGELYYAREKLKTSAAGLDRDTGNMMKDPKFLQMMDKKAEGRSLTQAEEKHLAQLGALNDTLRKNTEALLDANRTGDTGALLRQSSQVGTTAAGLRKTVGGGGMLDAVRSLGIGQIAGAINAGFSQWVGALDRSGIVSQYSSGDILGARVSERRRSANLIGGAARLVLPVLGAVGGTFLKPGGGTMAGFAAGTAAGEGIATAMQAGPNLDATMAAKAGAWFQRSDQAMELAALLTLPGRSVNSAGVRDAFRSGANAAEEFGFSAEDGMSAVAEAVRQGLDRTVATAVARQAFAFERSTGADGGTLASIANMSARFGAGDALATGWAGLQASGMSTGQFGEYLRAVQRVMEEGISRGFVRSGEDVARNLTMLARLTGNSPLWQGEQGARRLSEIKYPAAEQRGILRLVFHISIKQSGLLVISHLL